MIDIALKNAEAYVAQHELRITAQLGFGIHGTVHAVEDEIKREKSAIKAHLAAGPYERELSVYHRLKQAGITNILEFHVPQFIRTDGDLLVLEMSIVTRPFVLDFAGAYLDARPAFSEEIWADLEQQKREQFGDRWTTVRAVLDAFEEMDIYLADVTPNNIAFID